MSERSFYLRDQADKCRCHAKRIGNVATQVELLKLADEYADEAAEIEANDRRAGCRPPTLWFPNHGPQAPDAEASAE